MRHATRSATDALRKLAPLIAFAVVIGCQGDQSSITNVPRVARPSPQALTQTTGTLIPVMDTRLNLDAVNYSTDTILTLYTWPDNKVANVSLLTFDVSGIPAGSVISSATLNLYLSASDASSDPTYTITAHKVLNKNPDLGRATGWTYDGTNNWTANTCCSGGVPMAQADIDAAVDSRAVDKVVGFKQWDVTSIVQDWVNSPATNFGLLLNSDPSKLMDRYRYFSSSEYPDASQHPYLTVVYTAPSSAAWPNEPTGFTALTGADQNWSDWGSWQVDPQNGFMSLVSTQDGPLSPPSAIQWHFPQGMVGGGDPPWGMGKTSYAMPTSRYGREVFVGLWFKVDPNFQGHPSSGVQKVWYLDSDAGGPPGQFWLEIFGAGSDPLSVQVVTEFPGIASHQYAPNETDHNPDPHAGETSVTISRGVWHRYEVYLALPATSGGNGTCQVWLDGTLALSRTDMPMAFDSPRWFDFFHDPIWGGVGDTKLQDNYLWFDHTYISAP